MDVLKSPGGYRFLPVDGPFSAGVAAEPGYRIVRVRVPRHTPLEAGFQLVEETLGAAGRPLTSLCAMELRIPQPLTREGFAEFNKGYVAQHERWGLRVDGHLSPARTNVAPELEPPPGPSLHAFCHTVEGQGRPTFVISGAPEPPGTEGGLAAYWAAMGDIMEERMGALGVGWEDATETQFYGTRADHQLFDDEHLGHFRELVRPGLRWHFSRPPVDELRLEIDVRALARETWV
jgi:hypothetical protein